MQSWLTSRGNSPSLCQLCINIEQQRARFVIALCETRLKGTKRRGEKEIDQRHRHRAIAAAPPPTRRRRLPQPPPMMAVRRQNSHPGNSHSPISFPNTALPECGGAKCNGEGNGGEGKLPQPQERRKESQEEAMGKKQREQTTRRSDGPAE